VESRYKLPEHRREEWMREVHYRQRNIVYPETAMNGARFWRHLTSNKYPFTSGQKVCFVILLLLVVPPFAILPAMIIATLISDLPVWELAGFSSAVFMWFFYVVALPRAISAVFADIPPIPELPLSSRINMARQSGHSAATKLG
jgi:hypothetical protein